MSNLQLMSMYIEKELHEEIRSKSGDAGMSEFIRKAIRRELKLLDGESNELTKMVKQVENLNTKTTEQKVSDLEIKLQIIYEEIQRQNEVLALIHRRSTFAANFSLHSMDVLLKSNDLGDEEKATLIDLTTNELKNIGLQLSRK